MSRSCHHLPEAPHRQWAGLKVVILGQALADTSLDLVHTHTKA